MDTLTWTAPPRLVTRSDDVLGGVLVFAGTRVPVQTLLDYLEAGEGLKDFLGDFPTVSRKHAVEVLELVRAGRTELPRARAD
jgi:uncharacterized protein (DUF433 family)